MHTTSVVIASDHAGYTLKERIKQYLLDQGMKVIDVGTDSEESVDYPPIMRAACKVVLEKDIPGIILGGSGNGEAMAANKVRGIRAAVCYNDETARLARAHNDANVISIGARLTDEETARKMVGIFLSTEFEGGRHKKRIDDLESK